MKIREEVEGTILAMNEWTPQEAANHITDAWQNAVESIIETGRRLIESKERVQHGQWMEVVELLPFSQQTANRLMTIAHHPDLSNYAHGRNLPSSWRTLAVLAKLPAGQIPKRIESGDITPDLDRATAENMVTLYLVSEEIALNDWNEKRSQAVSILSFSKTWKPPNTDGVDSSIEEFINQIEEILIIAKTWRTH